jgi:hypothetical protein
LVRQVSATFETGNVRKGQVTPFGDRSLNGSNGSEATDADFATQILVV